MKFAPITKLDKRNKTTSKKFDDGVMSQNCDAIFIFFIYGQFGVFIYGLIVFKTSINSKLLSYNFYLLS